MINEVSLRQWLAWVVEQDPGMGLLFAGGGLILLILGWRLFRYLITASLAILSAVVAARVVPTEGWDTVGLVAAVALLGGYIAVRFARTGVALLSGGWTAALVLGVMVHLGAPPGAAAVAAAVAFAAIGAMAFAAVRPCVAFVTSVEGTILLLTGCSILLAGFPSYWVFVSDAIEHNPVFLPFAILAGTVTGYYVQLADMQEKESGLSPA